ncbi:TPA_asm: prepilin peptidase, partial [Salmonella enterica subsp. enterica serovar Reading]|nr:prepilin peptidase [Salmonella enterica]HAE2081581.1 prepilin peptidase [Salmonella enterica subsp. enterica serovar Reading]
AARVQWERENGIASDGDGLATLGSHGGNLFEPMDAEERRGTFEAVGGPDWGDD